MTSSLRVAHALSDKTRCDIIEYLSKGAHSTKELEEALQVHRGVLIRHTQILEHAGIIKSRLRDRHKVMSLSHCPFESLSGWMNSIISAESVDRPTISAQI